MESFTYVLAGRHACFLTEEAAEVGVVVETTGHTDLADGQRALTQEETGTLQPVALGIVAHTFARETLDAAVELETVQADGVCQALDIDVAAIHLGVEGIVDERQQLRGAHPPRIIAVAPEVSARSLCQRGEEFLLCRHNREDLMI